MKSSYLSNTEDLSDPPVNSLLTWAQRYHRNGYVARRHNCHGLRMMHNKCDQTPGLSATSLVNPHVFKCNQTVIERSVKV